MVGSLIPTYRDNTLGSRAQGEFATVQLACALWGEPCDKNGIAICSPELGNIKLYLQTQPRFRLQRHCKLLPSAAPSMSNLVIHSSVPCYSPLNLVWSPNPTPPLSPLPCNAMESTSALGRESTNLTREPKNEAEPKEIRNYCHETLKPWLACFFVHFHCPICYISCLQISPPFPALSTPLYLLHCVTSHISICVGYTLFSSINTYHPLNASPSLPIRRSICRSGGPVMNHASATSTRVRSWHSNPHNQNTITFNTPSASPCAAGRNVLKLLLTLRGRELQIHKTGRVGTVMIKTD
jgi:hypothetical protein